MVHFGDFDILKRSKSDLEILKKIENENVCSWGSQKQLLLITEGMEGSKISKMLITNTWKPS